MKKATYPQIPLHLTWTMHSCGLGSSSGDSPMKISWCSFVKRAGFGFEGLNVAIIGCRTSSWFWSGTRERYSTKDAEMENVISRCESVGEQTLKAKKACRWQIFMALQLHR